MPVDIRINPTALAQLAQLHEPMISRINRAMERLADWPAVSGAKPLVGKLKGRYRLRVGDWRIVFIVVGDVLTITKIANRRDVYED